MEVVARVDDILLDYLRRWKVGGQCLSNRGDEGRIVRGKREGFHPYDGRLLEEVEGHLVRLKNGAHVFDSLVQCALVVRTDPEDPIAETEGISLSQSPNAPYAEECGVLQSVSRVMALRSNSTAPLAWSIGSVYNLHPISVSLSSAYA